MQWSQLFGGGGKESYNISHLHFFAKRQNVTSKIMEMHNLDSLSEKIFCRGGGGMRGPRPPLNDFAPHFNDATQLICLGSRAYLGA